MEATPVAPVAAAAARAPMPAPAPVPVPAPVASLPSPDPSAATALAQLTCALGQLHAQFSTMAQTLSVVVQQLAVVTQQQQAQLPVLPLAAPSPSLLPPPGNLSPPLSASPETAISNAATAGSDQSPMLSSQCSDSDGESNALDTTAAARPSSGVEVASISMRVYGSETGPAAAASAAASAAAAAAACSDSDGSFSSDDDDDDDALERASRRLVALEEAEQELSESRSTKEHSISRERVKMARSQQRSTNTQIRQTLPDAATPSTAATPAAATPSHSAPPAVITSDSSSIGLLQCLKDSKDRRMASSSSPATAAQSASPPLMPAASAAAPSASSPRAAYVMPASPTHASFPQHHRTHSASLSSVPPARIPPSASAVSLDEPEARAGGQAQVVSPTRRPTPLTHSASMSAVNLSALHHANLRASSMQQQSCSPPQRVLSPARTMRGISVPLPTSSVPSGFPASSVSATPSLSPHRGHAHSQSADVSAFGLGGAGGGLLHTPGSHVYLPHKVKLNVGGQLFCTTLSTLLREPGGSMFSGMFSGHFSLGLGADGSGSGKADAGSDSGGSAASPRGGGGGAGGGGGGIGGAIFIDRDPTLFRHVLNYLRDGSLCLQGISQLQKQALLKEARYYGLGGLVSLLQLDARSLKSAQRRELSSEKEYKLLEDVPTGNLAAVLKSYTIEEGYEFEAWIGAGSVATKQPKSSAVGGKTGATVTHTTGVHLLFSKKLSRGELMLLDRLQNHS